MWINYLKTSMRVLRQNTFFVSMNLLSIAVAFALCTIGYFNYQFNAEFNKHFKDHDKIFKVNSKKTSANGGILMGITPLPLADAVNDEFPEITAARYTADNLHFKIADELFRQRTAFVDQEFLEIFDLQLVNERSAKFNNNELLISEKAAKQLFGDANPVGQSLEMVLSDGEDRLFTVGGVLKALPENTSFYFDIMLPLSDYKEIYNLDHYDWSVWVDGTFVKNEQNMTNDQVIQLLGSYLERQNKVNPDQEVAHYHISNLNKWGSYETSLHKSSFRDYLHPASVVGTISSAIAVLLLALFNFINTSLAISQKRLREIGVRKVMGGAGWDLKFQFFVESFAQVLIALLVSAVVTYYLSDAYNAIFPFDIVEFDRIAIIPFLLFMISIWLFAGLLAGIYPAFYVSKFQSVDIFRSKVRFTSKNLFTKILIVVQFTVCIYNVFSLIAFTENTFYQENLDRGYDINNSINIPLAENDKYDALKNELELIAGVEEVTGIATPVGFQTQAISIDYLGNEADVSSLKVGQSYLESLGVELLSGSFFQREADNERKILVNEMANNMLGGEILNDWIYVDGVRYNVVGVVKNFNLKPIMLNNYIQPTIIFYAPESAYAYANVRIATNDVSAIDKLIEKKWYDIHSDEMYLSFFQEDVLREVSETNRIMVTINSFIAFVTLLITSLGLYAQVSLSTQRRIKEFGIRKVLGAPLKHILYIMNKEIIFMLLLASIMGLIGANIVVNTVMDIVYAYHMEIKWSNFLWPVLAVFSIMMLSIAKIVFSAARSNPVDQLRLE
ncbi:MAG: ABC transporter permease [Bacteroidota bacterium]